MRKDRWDLFIYFQDGIHLFNNVLSSCGGPGSVLGSGIPPSKSPVHLGDIDPKQFFLKGVKTVIPGGEMEHTLRAFKLGQLT